MKKTLAYLACPYSHPDSAVRKRRLFAANWMASRLLAEGVYVYSPLTHNLPLDQQGTLTGWKNWQTFDLLMVSRCDKVIVMKMDGWQSSEGVLAECRHAQSLGLPIEEIQPPEDHILDSLIQDNSIEGLAMKLKQFYSDREWDQFHSPKNLAMNVAVEVGELLEPFRWLTEEQSSNLSEKAFKEVRDEIGDVINTLVALSTKLGIDLVQAGHDKVEKMGRKYPSHLCKGKALKYTEYESTIG